MLSQLDLANQVAVTKEALEIYAIVVIKLNDLSDVIPVWWDRHTWCP